ncbi:unnamed protein product [Linum tenue]|uniref:SET domain-containing protein n=1 Tax=Linum tenue TaxID=586396 RepID=A0AAV0M8A9_9ROSI|nr:unnamed protein product [Linum tenue]
MEEEARREDHHLDSFLAWAAELGVTDSPCNSMSQQNSNRCLGNSLVVSHFPDAGGRGLGAARDLRKGELVLRVPKAALFTTIRLLGDDPKLSSAVNGHPSLSPTQRLGVCLLHEMGKGRDSWWWPYLKQLPRGYDTLATFSEFEKQALQVDDAVWTAEKAILKAKMEWRQAKLVMEQLQFKPKFRSFGAWTWVCATISSRTMHVSWDEAGTLCPVGDFFNYAAPGEESSGLDGGCHTSESFLEDGLLANGIASDQLTTKGLNSHLDSFVDAGFEDHLAAYCFYARRDYKKGEQVLLAYGTYTNLDLLEHYGFLLAKNLNEKAFIPLEPGILSLTSWPQDSIYLHADGKPSFALLSALRFYVSSPQQRRSILHLVYSGSQLSEDNEINASRLLSKKCHEVLQSLPTTTEEDDLLLSVIERIQDMNCPVEVGKLLCSFRGEISAFLDGHKDLPAAHDKIVEFLLSSRAKSSLGKWKLAVQWRRGYKQIIADCICFCTEVIEGFSHQNEVNIPEP